MSVIYLYEECVRLKSYGATTRGEKSILRIELEIDDHWRLGAMLEDLRRIAADQKAQAKKTAKKPLALTYQPGESA